MMGARGAGLRVGLLILAGIGLLVGFLWFFGNRAVRHAELCESYFTESVQGLDVGSPVKYRGVSVGRVTELGLAVAEYETEPQFRTASYRQVVVRFDLDRDKLGHLPDLDQAIGEGLRSRLAAQGITGLSYIELDFVDPARYPATPPPWPPRATVIPSIPSTLAQVQDAAQEVLAKLNTVDFAALNISLTGLVQDLHKELATGDVHQTAVKVDALLDTLQATLVAADLPGLTADWRRTAQDVDATVRGADTRRLLAGGSQAAERLARAAAQLPPLIAALQATAQRTDNGTADLERTLVPVMRDIQAASQNLRELTDALRNAPAQVLLAAPPPRASREAP